MFKFQNFIESQHMKSSLALILILMYSFHSFAQPTEIKTTKQVIDEERYFEFKGTPYFFKKWVKAKLVQKDGNVQEGVLINFNGFTQNFEVNQSGAISILDKNQYERIVIEEKDNEDKKLFKDLSTLTFRQGFHEKFFNKFAQVLYDGEKMKLLKEISSELTIKDQASLGKIDEIKRFVTKEQYYLLTKGKLLFPIRIKNNQVLRVLGEPTEEDILKIKPQTVDSEERRTLEYFLEENGGYVTRFQDLLYSETGYYLAIEQELLLPIDLNKRSIFQAIGEEHLKEVKGYLKEQDNDLNSASKIIDLLKYYEQQYLVP